MFYVWQTANLYSTVWNMLDTASLRIAASNEECAVWFDIIICSSTKTLNSGGAHGGLIL